MTTEKPQRNKTRSAFESMRRFVDQFVFTRLASKEGPPINPAGHSVFQNLLVDITHNLAEAQNLDAFLVETAKILYQGLDLENAQIYLLESSGESMLRLAATARETAEPISTLGINTETIAGRAILEQKPIITTTLSPDPLTEMAQPLIAADHIVGVLLMQATVQGIFDEENHVIFSAIAGQLAVAINNAGLLKDIQRSQFLLTKRVKELNCLTDIGHKIDEAPTLSDFLDWVCSRIPDAMQYPEFCIAAITLGDQTYGNKDVLNAPSKMVGGIRVQGELLGYLHIAYTEPQDFIDAESALLGGVVNRVSSYIQTRRAEERLHQSQVRYELSIAGSNDGIWDWNIPSNEVFFSSRWKEMLGYENDELPNEFSEFESRIHPADQERVMRAITDYLEGQLPAFGIEFRMQHKNGNYRWILARGMVVRNQEGKPLRMAGSHTDITERKHTEELLSRRAEESEALYKGSARLVQAQQAEDVLLILVESSPVQRYDRANLYFFDRDWDLIPPGALKIVASWDKNEQAPTIPIGTVYTISSMPLAHILDHPEIAIIQDATTDSRLDEASRALMTQWRIRGMMGFPLVYAGQWFGLVTVETGKPISDISDEELRQIDGLVRQAAPVLQSQRLQNSLQQQIQELDAFQRIQNQQAWESYLHTTSQTTIGYAFDRVDIQKITNTEATSNKPAILRPIEVLGELVGNLSIQGTEALKPDEIEFIDTVSVELSQALERTRLVEQTRSALQDARLAEQELQKFRLGIEQSADAVLIMDLQGQIIYTNSAFTRIFGYTTKETLGKTPALLAPGRDDAASDFQKAFELGETTLGEILCKTKDGQLVPVESANTPIIGQDGSTLGFIAVQRDISERKQALEEIRRRSEDLTILNEMGRALASLLEEQAVYETIHEYTNRLMDASNFFVILYHEEENEFSFPFVIFDGERSDLPTTPVRKGLSEHIVRTQQPLLLSENVLQQMEEMGIEMVTIGDDEPALSWLGVPMVYRDRVVGVISVQNTKTPGVYKEIERDLLSTIASQAAIAITNARTLEQTQRQAEYEAMINAISQRIQSTVSVEEALQVAIRELGRALGSKRVAVQLGPEQPTISQK